MKYILICVIAMAVCIGLGAAATALWNKKHPMKKAARILLGGMLSLLFLAGVSLGYLSVYYQADSAAAKKLQSDAAVVVEEIPQGYFFDGPGKEEALIFYPGAKVEETAYAPLLHRLAEKGVDSFLLQVPFHMAMFGSGLAGEIMDAYDYQEWILCGHSLGGTIAANVAAQDERVSGLVLLASYPTKELPERVQLLSIYGSEDGCLNREAYEQSRSDWPEDAQELVIDGGNHAQFGSYGEQKGDQEARITTEEQLALTSKAVAEWMVPQNRR